MSYIIRGTNYVESLLLTLTSFEMTKPTIEVREYVTKRLEEEIISLSLSHRFLLNLYRDYVREILEKEIRDIPLPDLNSSPYLYEIVLDWMKRNSAQILGDRVYMMHPKDRDREIKDKCIRIIRTAIMGVLYDCGMVSMKTH